MYRITPSSEPEEINAINQVANTNRLSHPWEKVVSKSINSLVQVSMDFNMKKKSLNPLYLWQDFYELQMCSSMEQFGL